ncbi:hypothetical protein SBADM41S_11362 [Streptomyces badius]
MGIRSLLRKVFGRTEQDEPTTATVPPQAERTQSKETDTETTSAAEPAAEPKASIPAPASPSVSPSPSSDAGSTDRDGSLAVDLVAEAFDKASATSASPTVPAQGLAPEGTLDDAPAEVPKDTPKAEQPEEPVAAEKAQEAVPADEPVVVEEPVATGAAASSGADHDRPRPRRALEGHTGSGVHARTDVGGGGSTGGGPEEHAGDAPGHRGPGRPQGHRGPRSRDGTGHRRVPGHRGDHGSP